MGFCYFCWKEAEQLKKEIEYYQQQVGRLNSEIVLVEQINKSLRKIVEGRMTEYTEGLSTNKIKLKKIVKEALIARNMSEGEADNAISLLLK